MIGSAWNTRPWDGKFTHCVASSKVSPVYQGRYPTHNRPRDVEFCGGSMKLGIDFGTTRIVAAAVDRGNYPVTVFEDPEGAAHEWFPPLIASRNGERRYGWEAWAVQTESGWTLIRSIKRLLEDAGPHTAVQIENESVPILQLLEELTVAFKRALLDKSTVPGKAQELLEVMLGVPANANSNQRFL